MYKWKATIRTKWGDIEVSIDAPNQHIARALIESKYGKENIIGCEIRQA